MSSTSHHRSVSSDQEIHQYFPKTKCKRDHQGPPLITFLLRQLQHPHPSLSLLPQLASLSLFFLLAVDVKQKIFHLIPSFEAVLVMLLLLKTSTIIAFLDCNISFYSPSFPRSSVAILLKSLVNQNLPVLVFLFNQLLWRHESIFSLRDASLIVIRRITR